MRADGARTAVNGSSAIRKLVIPHRHGQSHPGHRRVQGGLIKLGHPIAASTVWQILHDAGIASAMATACPASLNTDTSLGPSPNATA